MNSFDDLKGPLASWQSATKSVFSSRRGQHEPTILKIDKLLEEYQSANNEPKQLSILDNLCFVLARWMSTYSGSRLAAAKQLLADAKEKRDLLKGKGVTAHRELVAPDSEVSIPDPVYPVFLARNKSPGDKYYTLGMLKGGGLGKDLNNEFLAQERQHNDDHPSQWSGLTYMSEEQRNRFLVEIKAGLLYHKINPERKLDTRTSHITGETVSNESYIYVMDGGGRIFSAAKQDVEHHSSFLAGNPAAAAGMMTVIDGKLDYVNGESGHYCPSKDEVDQFIAELRARGVDTSGIQIKALARRVQKQAISKSRGIKGPRLYPTGPREEWC